MKYVKELFSGANVGIICFEKPDVISFGGVLLQSMQKDGILCKSKLSISRSFKKFLGDSTLLNHFLIRFASYMK